jgi:hypothetical protein
MFRMNAPLKMLQWVLIASVFCLSAFAQAPNAPESRKSSGSNGYWHSQVNRLPKTQRNFYGNVWGVDSFSVKSVESGQIIRFSYRVVDPAKAQGFNDEKNQPSLIDPKAGVSLIVPSMEKIGQLRQVSAPEANKIYWMAFSNKGRKVKPGDMVSVVIGSFKIDNLIVQ